MPPYRVMPPRRIDTRRPPCVFAATTLVAATAAGARANIARFGVSHATARFARELAGKN